MPRLAAYLALLAEENERQNLVSAATMADAWTRHVADSAQLIRFAPADSAWLDMGTGAGFPGLVVAALHHGPVTLIEERKLRVDFLRRAADVLRVSHKIELIGSRAERVSPRPFDVISARAFAPLGRLLDLGSRFSTAKTLWILPKGRNARAELDAVRSSWQGDFRIEPSVTDPEAGIIVAQGVMRKRA